MLQSLPVCLVPPDTVRVATAALSRSNSYIKLRDYLGTVFEDQDFVSLFPSRGSAGICTVATGTRDGHAVC
jgi:transposase